MDPACPQCHHPRHLVLIPVLVGATWPLCSAPRGGSTPGTSSIPTRGGRRLSGSVSPAGDPAAEEWSQWSVCSLTCGQGSQVRTRSCVSSPYGTLCSGLLRETRTCNNTATCPGTGGRGGTGVGGGLHCCLGVPTMGWVPKGLSGRAAAGSGDGGGGVLGVWGLLQAGGAGGGHCPSHAGLLPAPLASPPSARLPGCTSFWETTRGAASQGRGLEGMAPRPVPPQRRCCHPGVCPRCSSVVAPLHPPPPTPANLGLPWLPGFALGEKWGLEPVPEDSGLGIIPAWRGGGPHSRGAGGARAAQCLEAGPGKERAGGVPGSRWAVYQPVCPWWCPCISRGTLGIRGATGCWSSSRAALAKPGMFWGLCTPKTHRCPLPSVPGSAALSRPSRDISASGGASFRMRPAGPHSFPGGAELLWV